MTAPVKVSDKCLRVYAGYSMKRAFNAIRADVTETLRPFGLRMVTFSALSIVVENPGLRQGQLADALSIERPNLVALVDELERLGLVERAKSPDDGRALALTPTARGRALCKRASVSLSGHLKAFCLSLVVVQYDMSVFL